MTMGISGGMLPCPAIAAVDMTTLQASHRLPWKAAAADHTLLS